MRYALLALVLTGCAALTEPPKPGDSRVGVCVPALYGVACEQMHFTPLGDAALYGDFANPKRP